MKLAIIGTGYWGSKILNTANTIPISTASYDINNDWQSADFDCAIVATPAETHYDITKQLLLKNKHVLVEKPIAESLDQVEELCNIAVQKNLILQSGHILMFTKTTEYLKNNIKNIKFLQTRRCNFGNIPKHEIPLSRHLLIHDLALVDCLQQESLTQHQITGADILNTANKDITNTHLTWQSFTSSHECSWFYPVKTRSIVAISESDLIYCDDVKNQVCHKVGCYNQKLELLEENAVSLIDESSPLQRELEYFVNSIEQNRLDGINGISHIMRVYNNLNKVENIV